MTKRKFFNIRLFSAMILILAAMSPANPAFADIYVIPCSYRAELMVKNHTGPQGIMIDSGRIGSNYVAGDIYYFRTWAEFDITALEGRTISDVGLMLWNQEAGTDMSPLRYCSVRPFYADQYALHAQHKVQNLYAGFSWTVSPNGAWTPADGFYMPDWDACRRIYGNGNSLIEDLQAHADDPGISWFAVEFSFTGSPMANLYFASDPSNPASIIMAVITESDFDKEKNQGACAGSCETCPAGGEPINFSTGNEYYSDGDFMLPGPGLPMGFARHYNRQSDETGCLG